MKYKYVYLLLIFMILFGCSNKEINGEKKEMKFAKKNQDTIYSGVSDYDILEVINFNDYILSVKVNDKVKKESIIGENKKGNTIDMKIENKKNQKEILNSNISTMKTKIKNLNSEKNNVNTSIQKLSTDSKNLKNRLSDVNNILSQDEIADNKEGLVLQKNSYENQLIELESNYKILIEKATSIDPNINEIKLSINNLLQQIKGIDYEIEELTTLKTLKCSYDGIITSIDKSKNIVTISSNKTFVNINISENEISEFENAKKITCEIKSKKTSESCSLVEIKNIDDAIGDNKMKFNAVLEIPKVYRKGLIINAKIENKGMDK